ncbi:MAG: hypothetical protein QME51_08600, partial [Planctomycetota bacterium]|nr:hypothetical protein [Planctomycetota bacterium]
KPDWDKINEEKRNYWEQKNKETAEQIKLGRAINNACLLVAKHPAFNNLKTIDEIYAALCGIADKIVLVEDGLVNFYTKDSIRGIDEKIEAKISEPEEDIPF